MASLGNIEGGLFEKKRCVFMATVYSETDKVSEWLLPVRTSATIIYRSLFNECKV